MAPNALLERLPESLLKILCMLRIEEQHLHWEESAFLLSFPTKFCSNSQMSTQNTNPLIPNWIAGHKPPSPESGNGMCLLQSSCALLNMFYIAEGMLPDALGSAFCFILY